MQYKSRGTFKSRLRQNWLCGGTIQCFGKGSISCFSLQTYVSSGSSTSAASCSLVLFNFTILLWTLGYQPTCVHCSVLNTIGSLPHMVSLFLLRVFLFHHGYTAPTYHSPLLTLFLLISGFLANKGTTSRDVCRTDTNMHAHAFTRAPLAAASLHRKQASGCYRSSPCSLSKV